MDNARETAHKVTITDRERVVIYGVLHVDSFDDGEIVLETDLGMLAIQGEELHIKHLNLDSGHLEVDGIIKVLDYLDEMGIDGVRAKSKGLLSRLLR